MLRTGVRTRLLILATACAVQLGGCCGTLFWSGKRCPTIYDPCCRSCCGLQYKECCTCCDDVRDRINQVSDIFSP